MTSTVKKTVLDNGIRVLSENMPGIRSVSVGVLVDVGPKNENEDTHGYAHLVEHMLFQGTGNRDAKEIAQMMAIGGGAIGAFTARDYTVYHATVLDDYLPFALEVLGDMLCNSVIPEGALERQQSVIINEIKSQASPLKRANDLLKMHFWNSHPLGMPTAGTEQSITNATRDSLLKFIAQHYVAENLTIAAAGNVSHDIFVEQVRDSFWDMSERDNSQQDISIEEPIPHLEKVVIEPTNVDQVYFTLAWPAPEYASENRYAFHLFTSLFGSGPTSRLYRTLREANGWTYYVDAQYHAYQQAGALVVEGATSPATLLPVLLNIMIELNKMTEETIEADVFSQVAQSLISQHFVSGDSAYVRMSRLAMQELYFKAPIHAEDVVTGISAPSIEDVQEVARSVLNSGFPTIILIGAVESTMFNQIKELFASMGGDVDIIIQS